MHDHQGMDGVLMHLLQAATYILPDYTQFDTTEFVASGYNIFGSLVGQQLVMAAGLFHGCDRSLVTSFSRRGRSRHESQRSRSLAKWLTSAAIALFLLPIAALSQPAAIDPGKPGQLGRRQAGAAARGQYNIAQAELGEIDPASETMKLSTLGLRGVAANILWGWANYYKKIEDWDKLEMTVNQIIRLQPNFVEVWDFQAHNLSYNVSVEFDDYRMRYQWVKKGIEFLILGSHYNRDEPGILRQVGWFTGQKIGRADEHKQFRRLFRDDKDFHQTFPQQRHRGR